MDQSEISYSLWASHSTWMNECLSSNMFQCFNYDSQIFNDIPLKTYESIGKRRCWMCGYTPWSTTIQMDLWSVYFDLRGHEFFIRLKQTTLSCGSRSVKTGRLTGFFSSNDFLWDFFLQHWAEANMLQHLPLQIYHHEKAFKSASSFLKFHGQVIE